LPGEDVQKAEEKQPALHGKEKFSSS